MSKLDAGLERYLSTFAGDTIIEAKGEIYRALKMKLEFKTFGDRFGYSGVGHTSENFLTVVQEVSSDLMANIDDVVEVFIENFTGYADRLVEAYNEYKAES